MASTTSKILVWTLVGTLSCFRLGLAQQLPQVDLGYEIHQAISYSPTSQLYSFTNIRYAQPAVGKLRFTAPQPPKGRNPVVQNGSSSVICPQALSPWSVVGAAFAAAYVIGEGFDVNAALAALAASNSSALMPDPRVTEDCLFWMWWCRNLFLSVESVIVPGEGDEKEPQYSSGRPIGDWIHGGAFILGSKGDLSNPTGLIEASKVDASGEGIVYVAINYRLGAFGWLSGPSLQSNGTANAGLYDQLRAIDWVRQHIHLFGGDPERITLMGESAGGGSIMHLMSAYGGTVPAPFKQAILQSPGFLPNTSESSQEATLQDFLSHVGVQTIEEARHLPSSELIKANAAQNGLLTPYSRNLYGPVVDGSLVPDLPGRLFLQGAFDKSIKVMASHNSNEGVIFTDARVTDDTSLAALIRHSFPDVQDAVVDYIIDTLYPAVYDGSQPYLNALERTILIVGEVGFTCNSNYVARGYMNETYNYQFSVPPSFHGYDIPYTFYNGVEDNPMVDATVAMALQAYLTSFAKTGVPSGADLPPFPMYGSEGTELSLNSSGIEPMKDPADNPRCRFWQKALYAENS